MTKPDDNEEHVRFASRVLRNLARRANTDAEMLTDLVNLRTMIDTTIDDVAVSALTKPADGGPPYTYQQLASMLNMSKQAVHQRYAARCHERTNAVNPS